MSRRETRKIWLVCAHASQYKNRRGYLIEGSRKHRSSTRSLKCPFYCHNWSHGKRRCFTHLGDSLSKRSKLQSHFEGHIQCKGDDPGRTTCWKNTNGNAARWDSGKQNFTCLRPRWSRSNNQAFLCTKLMRPTCKIISSCHDYGLYIQGQWVSIDCI